MAKYDTAIPPGGEGKITLKVNTKGYDGWISKRARVHTNDPRRRIMKLTLKAFVKVAIGQTTWHVTTDSDCHVRTMQSR